MIKVKNVTKQYGNFYAVRNINFEVGDGEIVGFLGRNGAGKTTTMNMITGFIEPTSGEIVVDGYNIDRKPKKVKSKIGYMPEGTPLYSDLTVKEFVKYMAELRGIPKKERKAAVEKAIKETGLEKVQHNLTKNLSRGYKQRVSMAGAIVGDPKILILDEPTVGLDPVQVIEIRELIKSFRNGHTVLISSHILSEINQICEKVIIIDKGEIIAVDTPKNLETKIADSISLNCTVIDISNEFKNLKDSIPEITAIRCNMEKDEESESEDQEVNYTVVIDLKNVSNINEIKKKISSECNKKNILIVGMSEEEGNLETAFIKLVEDRPEYSQKEIKKIQYERELEDLREEEKAIKEEKENKKQAKKEEKARKQALKEEKKKEKEEAKEQKDKNENTKETEEKDKPEVSEEDKKEGGDK